MIGCRIFRRNAFIIDPHKKIARVYENVDADRNSSKVPADLPGSRLPDRRASVHHRARA